MYRYSKAILSRYKNINNAPWIPSIRTGYGTWEVDRSTGREENRRKEKRTESLYISFVREDEYLPTRKTHPHIHAYIYLCVFEFKGWEERRNEAEKDTLREKYTSWRVSLAPKEKRKILDKMAPWVASSMYAVNAGHVTKYSFNANPIGLYSSIACCLFRTYHDSLSHSRDSAKPSMSVAISSFLKLTTDGELWWITLASPAPASASCRYQVSRIWRFSKWWHSCPFVRHLIVERGSRGILQMLVVVTAHLLVLDLLAPGLRRCQVECIWPSMPPSIPSFVRIESVFKVSFYLGFRIREPWTFTLNVAKCSGNAMSILLSRYYLLSYNSILLYFFLE